jgi:Replication-relaxation
MQNRLTSARVFALRSWTIKFDNGQYFISPTASTTSTDGASRIERFSAAPLLPRFSVTDRDERMMQAIARFRLLAPPQLLQIVGGSPRGIRNRLRILTAHKYLVRLKAKLTEPLVYGIANKGARFLASRGYTINPLIDWAAKNRCTDDFRTHTLEIAETMLHFDRATAVHGVGLIDHHEIHQHLPEHTQNSKRPFSLHVPIVHANKHSLTVAVVPDRLFEVVPEFCTGR